MTRFSRTVLLGTGLFALSWLASAQTYGGGYYQYPRSDGPYDRHHRTGEGYDDGYSHQREGDWDDGRYPDRRSGYGRSGSLMGHVLSDLDRAAAQAHLDGHEAKHFEDASRKLQEFDARWSRGHFDTDKLDKAIDHLQHLAAADRVYWRDRDVLARDLAELQRFRATRGRPTADDNRGYRPNWP